MKPFFTSVLLVASCACNAQTFRPWVPPPMIATSQGEPIKVERQSFGEHLVVHLAHDGSGEPYQISLKRADGVPFEVQLAATYLKEQAQAVVFITLPQEDLSRYRMTVVKQQGWSRKVVHEKLLSELPELRR